MPLRPEGHKYPESIWLFDHEQPQRWLRRLGRRLQRHFMSPLRSCIALRHQPSDLNYLGQTATPSTKCRLHAAL